MSNRPIEVSEEQARRMAEYECYPFQFVLSHWLDRENKFDANVSKGVPFACVRDVCGFVTMYVVVIAHAPQPVVSPVVLDVRPWWKRLLWID